MTAFPKRSEDEIGQMVDLVNAVEFHKFIGAEVVACGEGSAKVRFKTGENGLTPQGTVHGGVYSIGLEMAAGMAAGTVLPANQIGATADLFISVLRSAPVNAEVEVNAKVLKTGKALVFLESEAVCGGKIIATAKITKSVVTVGP